MIGTAIMKIMLRTPAKSIINGHKPVKTTAKTPQTNVARWFFTSPIEILAKFHKYNVSAFFMNLLEKGDYSSAFVFTEEIIERVSDCSI